ncbi:MAG: ribosome biogenesis GTPase Der [Proteobacteria bacterium]|nr:ribosome biogenesis GTPase Der [Pseudomonadota bacterium]
MSRPVVSIVGRPNVGKSSIFNKLLGRRKALVQDTPGVTRDRNYSLATLGERPIILCDTGGFEEHGVVAGGTMARLIREQALVAIDESDVIIFVMDLRAGLTAADEEIAQRLRACERPVIWVLNKADHPSTEPLAVEFYRLGIDEFHLVSAEHGVGLGELSDAAVAALPAEGQALGIVPEPLERPRRSHERVTKDKGGRMHFLGDAMPEEATTRRGPTPEVWDPRTGPDATTAADEDGYFVDGYPLLNDDRSLSSFNSVDATWVDGEGEFGEIPPEVPDEYEVQEFDGFVARVALLGRPNVGKSTLLNRLLGYQRSITSPEAGTTHDAVDAVIERDGRSWVLIDTAGVRRKSRVHERVEQLIVGRTIRTIEAAHLCLLVVDGSEGVTEQEAKLGALIADRGRALVILVNKWDLKPKGSAARKEFISQLRRRFPHLSYADVLFISARTGTGTHKIWDAIERADASHKLTIKTAPLNRWAQGIWELNPPPMHKHRPVRLYYSSQVGVRPPTFMFFCNQPRAIPDSWRRFLANQLRAAFPTPGSPLKLVFKDRTGA